MLFTLISVYFFVNPTFPKDCAIMEVRVGNRLFTFSIVHTNVNIYIMILMYKSIDVYYGSTLPATVEEQAFWLEPTLLENGYRAVQTEYTNVTFNTVAQYVGVSNTTITNAPVLYVCSLAVSIVYVIFYACKHTVNSPYTYLLCSVGHISTRPRALIQLLI